MKSITDLNLFIDKCTTLSSEDYHNLIAIFGKQLVNCQIDSYVESFLKEDFSLANQKLLWDRFGYYFATLEHSIFEQIAVQKLRKSDHQERERGGLSLEDEKLYGYHLLGRNYIKICCDEKKNKVDMLKVFSSICHVEVRNLVLEKFNYLYESISRVSDYDKEMQQFLLNYQQLCVDCQIPKISYQGDLLDEDVLLEQLDMYIRYSIAKDKFINSNYGLIRSVCFKYINDSEYDDLLLEGYFGLLKAIEGYDVRTGYSFSTYAINGINFIVRRYQLGRTRLIRLPNSVVQLGVKIEQFILDFSLNHDRIPTDEEIIHHFDITMNRLNWVRYLLHRFKCLSLDQSYLTDEEEVKSQSLLVDVIFDQRVYFEDDIINDDAFQMALKVVYDFVNNKLSDRERMIFMARLFEQRASTEIGDELGISRQRVEQIESNILMKIRKNPAIKKVNPFCE